MFGKILGVVIAVLAVLFVVYVIVKSFIDRKKGKTCCGDCSSCTACKHSKVTYDNDKK